jgi:hypothetical protein
MKLKENFKSLNTNFGRDAKYYHHNLNKCEKIADDYAIEFAIWTQTHGYELYSNGWKIFGEKVKSSKQLLEIFKKEKGL